MKPEDIVAAELTRQEWSVVLLALGELPTKYTYSLVEKLKALLTAPVSDADS